MSWSYDIAKSVYDALDGCGLLPECTYIWPGCEPPHEAWKTECDTPLWITFTEGVADDRGADTCPSSRTLSVQVKLWIKQCQPKYDEMGSLQLTREELMDQANAQADVRTRILDTLLAWSKLLCDGNCWDGCWDRQKFGQWECSGNTGEQCVLRTFTIEFYKES